MNLTIPLTSIKQLRDDLAPARRDLDLTAATDTRPWAPWSNYPVGRTDTNELAKTMLACATEDWHGDVVSPDFPTFMSLIHGAHVHLSADPSTILTTIGRSVFVATPYLNPKEHLHGLLLTINDAETPGSIGLGTIPFYTNRSNTIIHWATVDVGNLLNPAVPIYSSKLDTIVRSSVALWALAAYQVNHGMPPVLTNGIKLHMIEPPSPLVRLN